MGINAAQRASLRCKGGDAVFNDLSSDAIVYRGLLITPASAQTRPRLSDCASSVSIASLPKTGNGSPTTGKSLVIRQSPELPAAKFTLTMFIEAVRSIVSEPSQPHLLAHHAIGLGTIRDPDDQGALVQRCDLPQQFLPRGGGELILIGYSYRK